MGFVNFIKGIFNAETKEINISGPVGIEDAQKIAIAISKFAAFTAIEYIANIASKVEYKTYKDNKEIKGAEWYSLNVKPNLNQSSTEFWQEAIGNLLYSGELLIVPVGRQKIIATNFTKIDRAITESIFTGVTRNDFTFNKTFTASEVIYIKYANYDTMSILKQIFNVLSILITEATDKYIKSGGQKGTLEIPGAAASQIKDDEAFNKMISAGFKSFYAAKNAVYPLKNGIKYTDINSSKTTKAGNEVTDVKSLMDEALTKAAQSYKIPPQLLRGEVSGINDALDLFLTVCIDPLINCISEELTGKEFTETECLNGDYIKADSTNIKHVDIFSLANNIDKLISSAFMNVDETREKAGLKPTGEEWAKKHYITKNYEDIEKMLAAGGGEKENV